MKIKLEALQLLTARPPALRLPPGRLWPAASVATAHDRVPRQLPATGVSFRLPHLFRFLPQPDNADCQVCESAFVSPE